ncbi:hypothetical protein IQ06DRAFT_292687 [Phaeosphaeriaceae sp. SRC1lsM3a]|nr:hypothetical protein IQ06DRAFT_292687 [Stagonospora sp. SRC1lsM3a]
MRVLRNRLSGSDRLPTEQEDAEELARRKLHADMEEARDKDAEKVDMKILTEIQEH